MVQSAKSPLGRFTDVHTASTHTDICANLNRLRVRVLHPCAFRYKPHDKNWTDCADTILNPPNKRERRRWHAQDILIVIAP